MLGYKERARAGVIAQLHQPRVRAHAVGLSMPYTVGAGLQQALVLGRQPRGWAHYCRVCVGGWCAGAIRQLLLALTWAMRRAAPCASCRRSQLYQLQASGYAIAPSHSVLAALAAAGRRFVGCSLAPLWVIVGAAPCASSPCCRVAPFLLKSRVRDMELQNFCVL